MGRCVSKLGIVLEDDEFADCHFASCRGVVVFKHVDDGTEEQFQVVLGEMGYLSCQVCRNEAICAVERVGDDLFASHFRVLLCIVGFRGDGNTGNGNILPHDGVNAAGKSDLHGTAYLTAVELVLDKSGHDSAERADVVEVCAHEVAQFCVDLGVLLFQLLSLAEDCVVCAPVGNIERYAVFDVNAVARGIFHHILHIIADFALDAHVRHKPVSRFGIHAGHICGIGIPVRVPVFNVKQNGEFVPVLDNFAHDSASLFFFASAISLNFFWVW